MDIYPIVFHLFAALITISALGVVLMPSPIYSALSLALTMLFLSGLFFILDAQFLAAVQLMVYAGAVVVLFVMVLMLFDLRKENIPFSGNWRVNLSKLGVIALGFVLIALPCTYLMKASNSEWLQNRGLETKKLAELLFSKHIFAFEVVGALLTVVLIGAIALAKAKGGTHARAE